jgi:putative transcriptional regulator
MYTYVYIYFGRGPGCQLHRPGRLRDDVADFIFIVCCSTGCKSALVARGRCRTVEVCNCGDAGVAGFGHTVGGGSMVSERRRLQNAGLPDVGWVWVWPVMGGLLDRRPIDCPAEVLVKNKLRELRGERNWSQAELAERAGVSRQTINAIETEKYDPSLPLAFALARIFKVTIEELFDDRS